MQVSDSLIGNGMRKAQFRLFAIVGLGIGLWSLAGCGMKGPLVLPDVPPQKSGETLPQPQGPAPSSISREESSP